VKRATVAGPVTLQRKRKRRKLKGGIEETDRWMGVKEREEEEKIGK